VLVKDIRAGSGNSNPRNFASSGGTIYFSANDGTTGIELWKTDGSSDGTLLVKAIAAGGASARPSFITPFAGQVFFAANDAMNGIRLWTSKGTEADTRAFWPRSEDGPFDVANLSAQGPWLYLSATNAKGDATVWRTDATVAGTSELLDSAGQPVGEAASFVSLNGQVMFVGGDGSHAQLWRVVERP
jgi:ELWxxDGT repeat protein